MKQGDFLARFRSGSPARAPAFDKAELERWADDFWANQPAQRDAMAAQFAQALEQVGGKFYTANGAAEAARLACQIAQEHQARSVVAWDHPLLEDACGALRSAGVAVTVAGAGAMTEQARSKIRDACAAAGAGLTSCDYAIAETGSLLLIGSGRQARLASVLPPVHIALITPGHLVPAFADAVQLLRLESLRSPDGRLPSSIALHTGPSRTADIELTLTRGVHGPKDVHVVSVV